MVDYSKWTNIEISDDEDETHPNIDTASLFRWRHQARLERMEEQRKEKEKLEALKLANKEKCDAVKKKLENSDGDGDVHIKLKSELEELETEKAKLENKEKELIDKEKKMPLNVDTISQPGFTKTIVNKPKSRTVEHLSDEEHSKKFKDFVKQNEPLLKEFGMMRRYEDSKKFLLAHPQLACEDTANYLVVWCINLEMEQKHDLMEHVAHQTIAMQYLLELSKQLDYDPRSCISSFFTRIQSADKEYLDAFEQEVESFKGRVCRRAREKLDQALKEVEEEERKKRLGPGGLDPVEVFESLPEPLQRCFESRDISLLHKTIAEMDKAEATYHMKRCVESGLWVPEGDKNEGDETKAATSEGTYSEPDISTLKTSD